MKVFNNLLVINNYKKFNNKDDIINSLLLEKQIMSGDSPFIDKLLKVFKDYKTVYYLTKYY